MLHCAQASAIFQKSLSHQLTMSCSLFVASTAIPRQRRCFLSSKVELKKLAALECSYSCRGGAEVTLPQSDAALCRQFMMQFQSMHAVPNIQILGNQGAPALQNGPPRDARALVEARRHVPERLLYTAGGRGLQGAIQSASEALSGQQAIQFSNEAICGQQASFSGQGCSGSLPALQSANDALCGQQAVQSANEAVCGQQPRELFSCQGRSGSLPALCGTPTFQCTPAGGVQVRSSPALSPRETSDDSQSQTLSTFDSQPTDVGCSPVGPDAQAGAAIVSSHAFPKAKIARLSLADVLVGESHSGGRSCQSDALDVRKLAEQPVAKTELSPCKEEPEEKVDTQRLAIDALVPGVGHCTVEHSCNLPSPRSFENESSRCKEEPEFQICEAPCGTEAEPKGVELDLYNMMAEFVGSGSAAESQTSTLDDSRSVGDVLCAVEEVAPAVCGGATTTQKSTIGSSASLSDVRSAVENQAAPTTQCQDSRSAKPSLAQRMKADFSAMMSQRSEKTPSREAAHQPRDAQTPAVAPKHRISVKRSAPEQARDAPPPKSAKLRVGKEAVAAKPQELVAKSGVQTKGEHSRPLRVDNEKSRSQFLVRPGDFFDGKSIKFPYKGSAKSRAAAKAAAYKKLEEIKKMR